MKRDMELIRNILIKIEDEVDNTVKHNISIDGYSMEQVAYHCSLLYDGNLINDYAARYADGKLYIFGVGRLTWEGHEFLDKIKSDTIWNKTKDIVIKKGLPLAIDVLKDIAAAIISGMTQSAINGM